MKPAAVLFGWTEKPAHIHVAPNWLKVIIISQNVDCCVLVEHFSPARLRRKDLHKNANSELICVQFVRAACLLSVLQLSL